jgi:hypothetical protein
MYGQRKIELEFHTFTAQNSSRTEVVTMKIDRLLHKLWKEMSVSGQFCTNITKFTPDLSDTANEVGKYVLGLYVGEKHSIPSGFSGPTVQ